MLLSFFIELHYDHSYFKNRRLKSFNILDIEFYEISFFIIFEAFFTIFFEILKDNSKTTADQILPSGFLFLE
jgi:preprotein translocase subunit SecY